MFPASFDESNFIIAKPDSMTHDECAPLIALVVQDEAKYPVIISCWKLSQEELDEIIKTKRVWLTVYGTTMVPVAVDGIKPFRKT